MNKFKIIIFLSGFLFSSVDGIGATEDTSNKDRFVAHLVNWAKTTYTSLPRAVKNFEDKLRSTVRGIDEDRLDKAFSDFLFKNGLPKYLISDRELVTLKVFSNISPENRASFVKTVYSLMTHSISLGVKPEDPFFFKQVVLFLNTINPPEYEAFLGEYKAVVDNFKGARRRDQPGLILYKGLDPAAEGSLSLLEATKIFHNQGRKVKDLFPTLLRYESVASADVFCAYAQLGEDRAKEFLGNLVTNFDKRQRIMFSLLVFAGISETSWGEIKAFLPSPTNFNEGRDFLRALKMIPVENRMFAVRALKEIEASYFRTQGETPVDVNNPSYPWNFINNFLMTLSKVDAEDYEGVIKSAENILGAQKFDARPEAIDALYGNLMIWIKDFGIKRPDLIHILVKFLQKARNTRLVDALKTRISDSTDRTLPASYALGMALDDMVLDLLRNTLSVSSLGTAEKEDRFILSAARALLWMRHAADAEEKQSRLREMLETPLDEEIRKEGAVADGTPNPYMQGMNVHTGARDKRTRRAYDLLLEKVKLSEVEIEKAVDELKIYVLSTGNAKAIQALMAGVEGHPEIPGHFKSLLSGEEGGLFSEDGKVIRTDQELLGSLWHFVQGLPSPDKENALVGIKEALNLCVTEVGLICNPGKYQKLAIGALQGYLKGIRIDMEGTEGLESSGPGGAGAAAGAGGGAAMPDRARERRVYDRNLRTIMHYMTPVTKDWMKNHFQSGRTAARLFQEVFAILSELEESDVFLDPRDVVFYLIFGLGVDGNVKELEPDYSLVGTLSGANDGFGMFRFDDYVLMFNDQEKAQAEAARKLEEDRKIRAEQDKKYQDAVEEEDAAEAPRAELPAIEPSREEKRRLMLQAAEKRKGGVD